jgi:hypothetical protein
METDTHQEYYIHSNGIANWHNNSKCQLNILDYN